MELFIDEKFLKNVLLLLSSPVCEIIGLHYRPAQRCPPNKLEINLVVAPCSPRYRVVLTCVQKESCDKSVFKSCENANIHDVIETDGIERYNTGK